MQRRPIKPNFKRLDMLKENYDVNFLFAYTASEDLFQYLEPFVHPDFIDPDNENQQLGKEFSHIENALKEYVIMKGTAIVEQGYKNLITFLIDDVKIDASQIINSNSIEVPLDKIEQLSRKKITSGLLVADSLALSKPYLINKLLSKLLKLDFHNTLRNLPSIISKETLEKYDYEEMEDLQAMFDEKYTIGQEFEQIFEMRNEIAHNIKSPSIEKIWSLGHWIKATSLYLQYGTALVLFYALFCTKNTNFDSLLKLDYFKRRHRMDEPLSKESITILFEKIFGVSSFDLVEYIKSQQEKYRNHK